MHADTAIKVDNSTERASQLKPPAYSGISGEPGAGASENLMRRVQRGDMDAFEEIIRRFRRRVFRVISSHVRNPEDAMEVLQDTFLKVYTARKSWDGRFSFSGWLYRIAINASIDRYRRSDRLKTTPLEDVLESQLENSSTKPPANSPLGGLAEGERRRLLEEAVRRLPERQREVVSLRYFGEMSLDEIAAVLSCPLGTVKSNLHKAVMSLKNLLLREEGVLGYE